MGLSTQCKAECNQCGTTVTRIIKLDADTARTDIWSHCIPEGWLQIPFDKTTGLAYLFFCSDDCFKAWLQKQGRLDDIKALEESVPTAG